MGAYNVYTLRKTVSYRVVFKCEHCKKITIATNSFGVSSSYDDRGTLFGANLSKREEQAQYDLHKEETSVFPQITVDIMKRSFKGSGFQCVCGHCQAVPKWSKFRKKRLELLCYLFPVITFFAIFFIDDFIYSITNTDITDTFLLASIGISLLATVIPHVLYTLKTRQIRAMDEAYMPILCKDEHHLVQVLKELDLKEDIATNIVPSPNSNHS